MLFRAATVWMFRACYPIAMDAIKVTNLVKSYGDVKAVNGISLTIKKGEIFGLLGPNGAGKSTTLMILATLLKPTSGKASVGGFDVRMQPSAVRSSIGMVFQDPSSDDILTGYENLKLHALMYDLPLKTIDARIEKVLQLVDLTDRKNHLVREYSGGMRRRLEIARGLLHEPQILFLDEPTLGLDPQTREHIWEYIESLAKRMGMTIILTTHYMDEAEKLCDRIAIIDHGKIIALNSPDKLKQSLGGDIVHLKGKGLPADVVRELPYVRKVEVLPRALKLTVDHAANRLPEILRVIGAVDSVDVHSPDLTDVFLHLTGSEIRDGEGGVMEHVRAVTNARTNR
jgi:ABC-2 type transport system ATP-binding protein